MNTESLKTTLENLGFRLFDRGHYWSTSAIYRDGDNKSALQIYKNSGVWRDFVEGLGPWPFKFLVQKVLGTKNEQDIAKYINFNEYQEFENGIQKPTIKMEKKYDLGLLKDLLPHYKFYTDRGISEDTLKLYKSGFATKGKMNNRYVFPILDYESGQNIIGFTGRSMLWKKGDNYPKWKHIGTKKNWIYPLSLGDVFKKSCENNEEIIIAESVGDSMALTENGYKNHLVTFGVDLSYKQISAILAFEPKKIIISMNNDEDSKKNVGLISSIKHFISLMDFFDIEKIQIKLPIDNDFGESHKNGNIQKWVDKKVNFVKQLEFILDFLEKPENSNLFKKKDDLGNKIRKIKFHLDMDF